MKKIINFSFLHLIVVFLLLQRKLLHILLPCIFYDQIDINFIYACLIYTVTSNFM